MKIELVNNDKSVKVIETTAVTIGHFGFTYYVGNADTGHAEYVDYTDYQYVNIKE